MRININKETETTKSKNTHNSPHPFSSDVTQGGKLKIGNLKRYRAIFQGKTANVYIQPVK